LNALSLYGLSVVKGEIRRPSPGIRRRTPAGRRDGARRRSSRLRDCRDVRRPRRRRPCGERGPTHSAPIITAWASGWRSLPRASPRWTDSLPLVRFIRPATSLWRSGQHSNHSASRGFAGVSVGGRWAFIADKGTTVAPDPLLRIATSPRASLTRCAAARDWQTRPQYLAPARSCENGAPQCWHVDLVNGLFLQVAGATPVEIFGRSRFQARRDFPRARPGSRGTAGARRGDLSQFVPFQIAEGRKAEGDRCGDGRGLMT
jgi:hypothetical protein